MLVLNLGNLKKSESEWVYFDTKDGVLSIRLKKIGNETRMVIDSPDTINIQKGNKNAKTAINSDFTSDNCD